MGHAVQHAVAGDAGIVDKHLDLPDLVLDIHHALLAGDIVADVPFEDLDRGLLLEALAASSLRP